MNRCATNTIAPAHSPRRGNQKENRTTADEIDRLKARIAALEAKQKWQPIETAPEAGTTAIVYFSEFNVILTATYVGKWMSRGEEVFPTHWMPLPDAPKGEQNDE